ncbi:phosphoribosylamine--glycine ligase [Thermaurantiacus sp.]
MRRLRILLLGSGGREHALAWKLAQSPRLEALFASPGNPGIARHGLVDPTLDILDPEAVVAHAHARRVDLVVVGPEAPLAAGVADALRAAGIAVVGPSQAAARLESSKAFAKALCDEAGIPTARWARFDDLGAARAHVLGLPLPVVVKADGLAAGKGVTVAQSHAEALAALEALAASGETTVVIEEFLAGEEASFFVLAHGRTAVPLIAARDHKRLLEGDRGPNTGGMGAIAPAPAFTAAQAAETMARIVEPALRTLAARGTPFSGILFCGLMLTREGPKLIEFNVRFGDPECQVLLMLLKTDLLDLLEATATGRLEGLVPRFRPGFAVGIVVAARGYPDAPVKGGAIEGLETCGATVFHAGTARKGGQLVAAGGRVLTVCATGETAAGAAREAYAALERVSFADGIFRRDIGRSEGGTAA